MADSETSASEDKSGSETMAQASKVAKRPARTAKHEARIARREARIARYEARIAKHKARLAKHKARMAAENRSKKQKQADWAEKRELLHERVSVIVRRFYTYSFLGIEAGLSKGMEDETMNDLPVFFMCQREGNIVMRILDRSVDTWNAHIHSVNSVAIRTGFSNELCREAARKRLKEAHMLSLAEREGYIDGVEAHLAAADHECAEEALKICVNKGLLDGVRRRWPTPQHLEEAESVYSKLTRLCDEEDEVSRTVVAQAAFFLHASKPWDRGLLEEEDIAKCIIKYNKVHYKGDEGAAALWQTCTFPEFRFEDNPKLFVSNAKGKDRKASSNSENSKTVTPTVGITDLPKLMRLSKIGLTGMTAALYLDALAAAYPPSPTTHELDGFGFFANFFANEAGAREPPSL